MIKEANKFIESQTTNEEIIRRREESILDKDEK